MTCVVFSLFTKQLLTLYTLVGALGSNAENGQNQQRKLKWFTVALHMNFLSLSLTLQLALLFLDCALTVYMWKINHVIASFTLYFTVCIIPLYIAFGLLALANIGVLRFTLLIREALDWVTSRSFGTPEGINP